MPCPICGQALGHSEQCSARKVQELQKDAVRPDHYNGTGMQVWDVWDAFKVGVYESNIIKYILRHREKNGVEDLKKARTYLDRLIAQEEAKQPNG